MLRRYIGSSPRILFYICVFLSVYVPLLFAGLHGNISVPAILLLSAVIITTSGELLLHAFGMQRLRGWLPACFAAGVSVTSCLVFLLTIAFEWTAGTSFLICAGVVLCLAPVLPRLRRGSTPAVSWQQPAAALLFGLTIGYFCRNQISAWPDLLAGRPLAAWTDFFIHGTTIASFGSPLAVKAGDIMLSGTPRTFYHYAPFMLPASLSELTGLPGIALATAVLLPLGLFVGMCGIYALAAEFAGETLAVLIAMLVACLPDASAYWFRNGYFSFHWLVYSSPGTGYAIGCACVAYASMQRWLRQRDVRALVLSVLLATLLILIRAHMFLLTAPAFAGAILLSFIPQSHRPRAAIAGAAAVIILSGLVLLGALGPFPLAFSKPTTFLGMAFGYGPPSLSRMFQQSEIFSPAAATFFGALALFPATLGLWAFIFPLSLWLEKRASRLRTDDYLPALFCVTYLLLIWWAPEASNNDLTEYKERHFPLLYTIIISWTLARLSIASGLKGWIETVRLGPLFCGASAAWLVMVFLCSDVDAGMPSRYIPWGMEVYNQPAVSGGAEAAAFVAARSRPGDVVAVSINGATGNSLSPATELASMSDLPIYVGRINLALNTRAPAIAALAKARAQVVNEIEAAPDAASANAGLRANGIRWLLTIGPDVPAWDPTGALADFRRGVIRVYHAHS